MAAIDLKKELKQLYSPSAKEVRVVDVPAMNFIMLDGRGDPNGAAFAAATQTLYALAYAVKFALKRSGNDYTVMPLEGLWWVEGVTEVDPTTSDRETWQWRLMIRQPEPVNGNLITQMAAEVSKKKNLPLLDSVRFASFAEGQAAQLLHLGPYRDEPLSLARLHQFIAAQGGKPHGKHHEIYLGDPRNRNAAKLRTVLRQPYAASVPDK